jgi:hypothetical protein
MTRRWLSRRAVLAMLVSAGCLFTSTAQAHHYQGDGSGFVNATFEASSSSTVADRSTGVVFRIAQPDHSAPIKSYVFSVPPWRMAFASIDQSSVASCAAMNGIDTGQEFKVAESVGTFEVRIHTDVTRDEKPRQEDNVAADVSNAVSTAGRGQTPEVGKQAGVPALFRGPILFLKWNAATTTATLCGYARTFNSRVPGLSRELMVEITAALDATTKSWRLSFAHLAVPGAAAGVRSLLDNAQLKGQNLSILETRFGFDAITGGELSQCQTPANPQNCDQHWNRDAAGNPAPVALTKTPLLPGQYTMSTELTPCPMGDPLGCGSTGGITRLSRLIPVTTEPVGFHPIATLLKPAPFSVITGTGVVPLEWTPPGTAPDDAVKAYLLVLAHPKNKVETTGYYVKRFVVDPTDPAYDSSLDPCAPTDTGVRCATTLDFPLNSWDGKLLDREGLYSMLMFTIFKDGHRSDGRCDDGTFTGAVAPCADGTTPAMAAPGYAASEFMLRRTEWPLVYERKIIQRSLAFGLLPANGKVDHVEVLMANLVTHRFEFIYWTPAVAIETHAGSDAWTINGVNEGAGVVNYASPTFVLNATLGPMNAAGSYTKIVTSPTPAVTTVPFSMTRI